MTYHRVHTNSAPMAGKQAIEPMADWATASKRGTIRLVLLVAGLGIAATLLAVGVGL